MKPNKGKQSANAVLLDVTRLFYRALQGRLPTGIDRIGLAYLEYFQGKAQALVRCAGRWVVFTPQGSVRLFSLLLQPEPRLSWKLCGLLFRNYFLFHPVLKGSILLNTSHSGLVSPEYTIKSRRLGIRPVYYLHDLIPITYPEFGRPGGVEKHHRRLETMLITGRGIVTNSEETCCELRRYAQEKNRKVPPCVVAFPAPAKLIGRESTPPLSRDYFVILATIEPRKNHLLLLYLWRELVEKMGKEAPCLVMIGRRGWECEQVEDILDRCDLLKGTVIELSSCPDDQLVNWIKYAKALLFPSFIEGFGIPLVEALSLGTPVIASDLPVFKEIAGDIPEYYHPLDGLGWRGAILEYLKPESSRRQAQLDRMANYAPPTWKTHFEKVEALLKEVYDD